MYLFAWYTAYICVYIYINLTCILWCLWHLKKKEKNLSGKTSPPRLASSLEITRELAWGKPLICRSNQSKIHSTNHSKLVYTPQQARVLLLNCPRIGPRELKLENTICKPVNINPNAILNCLHLCLALLTLIEDMSFPHFCFCLWSVPGFSCGPVRWSRVSWLPMGNRSNNGHPSFSGLDLSARSLSHIYKLRPDAKCRRSHNIFTRRLSTWGYLPFFFFPGMSPSKGKEWFESLHLNIFSLLCFSHIWD